MKIPYVLSAFLLGSLCPAAGDGYLYTRYMHSQVIEQVMQQRPVLTGSLDESRAGEVSNAMHSWQKQQLGALRRGLEQTLGEDAKSEFSGFVKRYHKAESEEDAEFLKQLVADLQIANTPESYGALRQQAMERTQDSLLPEAAAFLGEIETWAGFPEDAPSLETWLKRDQEPPRPAPSPTPKPILNPLQAAEAGGGQWVPPEEDSTNPMQSFRQSRDDKRAQALEEAHAGMRQVAGERESWERENASKELAKAQADADAMRAQAQRLAATEEEALAQRENSWGNRLKRIVGGAVSTTIGSFTGGIGAEVGQRAADAVFN